MASSIACRRAAERPTSAGLAVGQPSVGACWARTEFAITVNRISRRSERCMAIIDALRGEKLPGHFEQRLQRWIARKLQIGQTHAVDQYLVGADSGRRVEANG